jgi:hypothetical protein
MPRSERDEGRPLRSALLPWRLCGDSAGAGHTREVRSSTPPRADRLSRDELFHRPPGGETAPALRGEATRSRHRTTGPPGDDRREGRLEAARFPEGMTEPPQFPCARPRSSRGSLSVRIGGRVHPIRTDTEHYATPGPRGWKQSFRPRASSRRAGIPRDSKRLAVPPGEWCTPRAAASDQRPRTASAECVQLLDECVGESRPPIVRRPGDAANAPLTRPWCLGFPVSLGELAYRRRTGGRRTDSRGRSASLHTTSADRWITTSKREPSDPGNLGKGRAAGAPRNASRDERYWEVRGTSATRCHRYSAFNPPQVADSTAIVPTHTVV